MSHSRTLPIFVFTALALLLCACGPISSITVGGHGRHSVHSDGHRHKGPPPHAPAHGYRHKHHHHGQDLELAFDSDLGVYIVLEVPDHYYWNGYYLRLDGDRWYASVDLHGGWEERSRDSLPPGMRGHEKHSKAKSKKKKSKKSKRHHRSHPAKPGW